MSLNQQIQNKKKPVPKKAIQAEKLLNIIFERDPDKGGVVVELTGLSGSGKTSLMLGFATRIIKQNPGELVFWREATNTPCQFNKIKDDIECRLLVEKNFKIKILEITNNLQPAPIEFKTFTSIKNLISLCKPGCLNVVYFKDLYRWIDLIIHLRLLPGFKSIFWDEYEDVCPQRCKDIVWAKNDLLSSNVKQLRKSGISLIMNTQSNMDADYRIRSKIMSWIYCYGAKVDTLSPITDSAVHSLRVGQGWIDFGHSLYGQFSFPPYLPKKNIYTVVEEDI